MKKYVAIIIIIIIVLIAGYMVFKKPKEETLNITTNQITETSNNTTENVAESNTYKIPNISDAEQIKLKNYINTLYLYSEITGTCLPEFSNINNADEQWVWEVVKRSLLAEDDDFEYTYTQIEDKAKETFGDEFSVKFPEEGSGFLILQENGSYMATGMGLDDEEEYYVIKDVTKSGEIYTVEIAEYIIDVLNMHQAFEEFDGAEDVVYDIYLKYQLGGEILETYRSDVETEKIEKYVLEHSGQFSKLKLEIEEDSSTGELYVISVTRDRD